MLHVQKWCVICPECPKRVKKAFGEAVWGRKLPKKSRKAQKLVNGRYLNDACPKIVCDLFRIPKTCKKAFGEAVWGQKLTKMFRKAQKSVLHGSRSAKAHTKEAHTDIAPDFGPRRFS